MFCQKCGCLLTFGGPPCCDGYDRNQDRKTAPDYGFDLSKFLGPPIDTTSLSLKVSRQIAEATEKLLEKWVADGLPLERADPKWEIGDPTAPDFRITVRVWIEWREMSDDETVTI